MKKTACWILAIAALVIGSPEARAGSLDPTNAPGPTMHTLEEIYQKVSFLGPAQALSPTSTVLEAGYYDATTLGTVDPDLVASNIRAGVTIFGITGTYADCDPSPGGTNYLVIDLSDGPTATSYPVSYLDAVPPGGWTDEYKTTKLVLRRIPAGTFTMGSPTNELGRDTDETQHQVTLTKDFYIGVFEVTQDQWYRVKGTYPSYFNNATYRDSRPVETVSYFDIRENSGDTDDPSVDWPANSVVNTNSFMGRLRARTGLSTLDLPTESQWEYAGRAGTTTALNSGNNLTNISADASMDAVGRYYYNGFSPYSQNGDTSVGTATVGSYQPNAWGLYDMHGNVYEWCLDWYVTYPGTVTDPAGPASGSFRVRRGGYWYVFPRNCRSAYRNFYAPNYRHNYCGFRLARTLP